MSAAVASLRQEGYCVLPAHFPPALIHACRDAFWPILETYLAAHADQPNRGPNRHFLPIPFRAPCFAPEFFFDPEILAIVHALLGDRIVADQWGCDVPLQGSVYQNPHIDYQRPLFEEAPGLVLPPYFLIVSFGLVPITPQNGPIEIAPGTHRTPEAEVPFRPVPLAIGDVLIRHPWAIHRGAPNTTAIPRALASIRYVRRWYADDSREVAPMDLVTWQSLTPAQQSLLRFR